MPTDEPQRDTERLRLELRAELRDILVERLRVPLRPEQIDPDTMLFGSGLGLDSVDAVDLAVEIERRRQIRIGDSVERRQCMRSLATLTEELLAQTLGHAPAPRQRLCFAADDPSELAGECEALRHRVGLALEPDTHRVRIHGSAAFELLDRLSTRDVFIRSGQILHTLFLDPEGRAWADVYAAADDEDFVLFVEGPTREQLLEHLREAVAPGEAVEIIDLEPEHALLDLSGPFAWELMERLIGPEVLGIPYLNFFDLHELGGLAFRLGKTGEYAYQLLIPRTAASAAEQRLRELGEAFELAAVSDQAIDLCGLETGFFCAREPALRRLDPIELQLGWRLSPEREVPGMAALEAAAHIDRIAWFRAAPGRAPEADAALFLEDGQRRGRVAVSHRSAAAGAHVGIALLERAWAEPGLCFLDEAGAPLLTTAVAPLVRSLSLYVDPQRHTYATREEDGLLDLV